MKVRIRLGTETFEGEIFDTPAGRALVEALPLETLFQAWGDELSFSVPMHFQPLEAGAESLMAAGDIGYRPDDESLSIFLGSGPAGSGDEPSVRAPLIRVGRISGEPERLRDLAGSPTLRIEPSS